VISPLALLRIGPQFLYRRRQRRRAGYREFKTEEWTGALYHRRLFEKPLDRSLFSNRLQQDLQSGEWNNYRVDFARAASLKLWLEALQP